MLLMGLRRKVRHTTRPQFGNSRGWESFVNEKVTCKYEISEVWIKGQRKYCGLRWNEFSHGSMLFCMEVKIIRKTRILFTCLRLIYEIYVFDALISTKAV